MFWLNVLTRWLHVASAVVAVGGLVVMRAAVLPALGRVPKGGEVYAQIQPHFRRLLHGALGLLLLTGAYNYWVAIQKIRELKEQNPEAMAGYHGVMGVKILLSLVVFGVAALALKPLPEAQEGAGKRMTWFSAASLLGLVITLLAAYLRRMW